MENSIWKKTCTRIRQVRERIRKTYGKIFHKPAAFLRRITEKPLARIRKWEERPFLFTVGLGLLLYLIIEMLSRRSVIQGAAYLVQHPLLFLYNSLIVIVTLSVALLFRRKEFVYSLVSIIWLGLGITNCVLLGFRTTPLNAMDFRTFKNVMGIVTVYFTKTQIAMIAAGVAVMACIIALIFVKSPKIKRSPARALASIAVLGVTLSAATTFSVSSGSLATTFHNIQDAYKDYGFAYCFACSVVDRGISEPEDYSEDSIQAIVDEINQAGGNAEAVRSENATEETPNIVFLQMESFFDVNHLKDVTFSENPVPNFTEMKENYTSGWLTTPSFGAGTANTEFEVLSGMSLEYFGPGEYPFTTIMRETTSESVAYDLKDYGYSTHAIHNHTGKFYGRYLVYPNLGFDSYTSVEYMQNVERNPLDWAEDKCLTEEIKKAMDSTDEQDFVFAVSVQGHGKYPTEQIDPDQTITVSGFNEEEAVGFEYYVNQIHEMDEFLGDVTDMLEDSGEPCVLVVYGDHLPKFSFEPEDLENENIYQTEYVVWNNFGMEKKDKDLKTYQLYSYVMDQLDMHNGIITSLHQKLEGSSNYYSSLHALQYDILYGESYCYGGVKPFVPTDMQMGIDPITISDIGVSGDVLYITGENFTSASKIFINGDQVKTTFINSGRIEAEEGDSIDEDDEIEVIQMSSQKTHLSSTGVWIWKGNGAVRASDEIIDGNDAIMSEISDEELQADIREDGAESR